MFPRRTSSVTLELFATRLGRSKQIRSEFETSTFISGQYANTAYLDPLVVKEAQKVERSKVDALSAVQNDFVAGRPAAEKVFRLNLFLLKSCILD